MNCTGCVANRTLGPRLVEHDGIDLRKALKGAAVLERHALLEQPPSRDNLNHRHRQAQCARACDDQHRYRHRQRAVPVSRGRHPAEERDDSERVDDGRVEGGGTVRKLPVSGSSMLRRFHHADHARNEGVGRGLRDADLERTVKVHHAGKDVAAWFHHGGCCFPCNQSRVYIGST